MNALYLAGLAVLAAMQVGDVMSTNLVISQGGHESNPVLARLMKVLGPVWWGAAKIAIVGVAIVILWFMGPQLVSWVGLAVLLGAFGWVINHNLGVARRQRERAALRLNKGV